MSVLATTYARGLGAIFVFIAFVMLLAPDANLKAHGLTFNQYNIAGQAEISCVSKVVIEPGGIVFAGLLQFCHQY